MVGLNATRHLSVLGIVLLVTVTAVADNTSNTDLNAFAGTWQEDLSKTVRTPTGENRKYEQNPDGTMSVTVGANLYHDRFRIDGKPHPEVPRPDVMQTWTQTGPSSWESIDTKDGRVISTVKRSVSADGRTLTFITTLKTDGRKDYTETTVYNRISTEKGGLAGTWKPVSVHADTPDVFSLRVTPDGALSYRSPEGSFSVKPDGNQQTVKRGPVDSVSMRFSGDRTISFTFFTKGKPIAVNTVTLSSDGQSLTDTSRNADSNTASETQIFRKQPD